MLLVVYLERLHFDLQSPSPEADFSLYGFSDDIISVHSQTYKNDDSFRKMFDPRRGAGYPLQMSDLKPDPDMKNMVKKHRVLQLQ